MGSAQMGSAELSFLLIYVGYFWGKQTLTNLMPDRSGVSTSLQNTLETSKQQDLLKWLASDTYLLVFQKSCDLPNDPKTAHTKRCKVIRSKTVFVPQMLNKMENMISCNTN